MSGLLYAQHVEPDNKTVQEKLQWANVSEGKLNVFTWKKDLVHSDIVLLLSGAEGEESTNRSLYNWTGVDL